MIRKIVHIDEEKCTGCGLCAQACHESAIQMVEGKARLVKDDYCDGLGDCLPACPADAIQIIEREAAAYDEAAVKARQQAAGSADEADWDAEGVRAGAEPLACGCPGSAARELRPAGVGRVAAPAAASAVRAAAKPVSELRQWPVQIQLVPVKAPYYQGAKLLIAADCTAYAYAAFHEDFVRGHIVLVGCPKLDPVEYSEKVTEILKQNDIKSVQIVRMEVPCCGGLEYAAKAALQASGKFIPWQVTTISCDGRVLED